MCKLRLIWEDGYTRDVDILKYALNGHRNGEKRPVTAKWIGKIPKLTDELKKEIIGAMASGFDLERLLKDLQCVEKV